ncbi:MAG: FapA family protein, partial [Lachnospiraceae bacterium]|nr:FapA family protein [Lachnospiraceae bacterium]
NESNRDGLYVEISKDDMAAYIRFDSSKFGITTRKDILRTLRLLGITQNINPRMMDDLLTGKHLDELVEIARGTPAVNGADGYYEYFFEVNRDHSPKMNPDGSVDFQTVEWFEQVKKDQKLAYYHSAGKGEAGSTVTGKRIAPKKGRELQSLRGKGFVQLPDKKTYIASFDGMVKLDGFKLEVSQILSVPEVTLATGNIQFEGNLEVQGDVTSGVKIIAGGNVIINGFLEAARVEAGGDVILKKGANGRGIGYISAGGIVEARFFEGITVKAGDRIDTNYSLNSHLYSEDSIVIHGSKGMILGGTAFAIREIRVNNVGNSAGTKSIITLGASEKMHSDLRKLEERLAELDGQMIVLMKGKSDFEKKFPPEVRNIMETYIKINNAIYTLKLQRDEASAKKTRLFDQIAKTVDAHMVVTGDLFDGNIIDINGKKLKTVYANNVTVKSVLNRVGIFKN